MMITMNRILTLLLLPILMFGCMKNSQEPEAELVITSAILIDGTGTPPQRDVSIHIRDGRITDITTAGKTDIPDEARVIDAVGKYIIPGLADMHVHFSLGAPLPRRPGTTEAVLARKLYYGVTSILTLGTSDAWTESIQELRAKRSAGELHAPYIYGTGGHLTLQDTHPIYTIFPPAVREAADSIAAETPMSEPVNLYSLGIGLSLVRIHEAARKAVRERAAGGMDAIKITVESGPTPFGDDHPQMPVEMIRAIVDEATLYGMPVLLVQAGLTPMEAIRAATQRAAESIGKNDDFGTIEPGKRADLLILGENPLDDIRNTRSLETVIAEGKVIDRASLPIHTNQ